jgi:phosphoenolpyruvate---glycerone phosphotransferase subunit DhaL
MTFQNKDGIIIIRNLIGTIQTNKDYLSEIDGKIGDGDHGINMNKGFTLCETRINGKGLSMSEAFETLGTTLLNDIGGSMGPLYGLFFTSLAAESQGSEEIDSHTFSKMLETALMEIQDIGNAKKGDKTLLDTLIPAVEAFNSASAETQDFKLALSAMKEAAHDGWRSTENMIAKIGRASRLGERSRGVLDAGATSCYLIIASMADSILELLN